MHIVSAIIKHLGGPSATAEKTGTAQQTVSSWLNREPPEIPPWHRPVVLAALQRELSEEPVPEGALTYLASRRRTRRAQQEAQAA